MQELDGKAKRRARHRRGSAERAVVALVGVCLLVVVTWAAFRPPRPVTRKQPPRLTPAERWREPASFANRSFAARRENYERTLRTALDEITERLPVAAAATIDRRNLREYLTVAYCYLRLHQSTRRDQDLDQADAIFHRALEAMGDKVLRDRHLNPFFVADVFGDVYDGLQAAGRIQDSDAAIVAAYLVELRPKLSKEDNQDLAFASALARLATLFPEHENRPWWLEQAEIVWSKWYAYKHNVENATTYSAIGWNAVFQYARQSGTVDRLDQAALHAVFEDMSSLVSPTGAVPAFGDSYFGKSWTYWVLFLENVAALRMDSRFAELAEKVYWWGTQNYPPLGSHNEERNLAELTRLKPLADLLGWLSYPESERSSAVNYESRVLMRRIAPGRAVPDKLQLFSGDADRRSMVLVDLFANGFHSHRNRRGAILYYEAGGIPFFHTLDRHNKSVEDANTLAVLPASFEHYFPANHKQRHSQWTSERIPLRVMADNLGGILPTLDLQRVVFRFSAKRSNPGILVANLRLVGPGGEVMLDELSGERAWTGDFSNMTRPNAAACMFIGGDPGVQFVSSGPWMRRSVDLSQYHFLVYDWKDESPYQRNRVLCRIYTGHRLGHFDFDARNHHAYPRLVRHQVEQDQAGEAVATLEFADHAVVGDRWVRKIRLQASGRLGVVDRYYLPKNASSQLVGPVWNYHYTRVGNQDGWFASATGERSWRRATSMGGAHPDQGLLVWFSSAEAHGELERRLHLGYVPTVFARNRVQPGEWSENRMVVSPVLRGNDPRPLARASQKWAAELD